jgi:methylthioribose-1-phosphate isomerase
VRHQHDGAVQTAGRSSGLLPHVLCCARAGGVRLKIETPQAVRWADNAVEYVDQRSLPHETVVRRAASAEELQEAIRTLAVRGAPCIGVFGAYGVALLRAQISDDAKFHDAVARVREARPTAVNLRWAIERVLSSQDMLAEAKAIHAEQIETDRRIAEAAAELIERDAKIYTHCHTGSLATAGGGTALGTILFAARAGKRPRVFVGETRPLLQGARLTYYELTQAGVDATLVVDSAAAISMQRKEIDLVIVGADRIARNGDTANKIGTYGLAILAAHHRIPFYVAAPRSTFDFNLATGAEIPIEERAAEEVAGFGETRTALPGATAYNPAFDVTPNHLITAFITEYGILRPPYGESIADLQLRPNLSALLSS